jgi:hypothetical protein
MLQIIPVGRARRAAGAPWPSRPSTRRIVQQLDAELMKEAATRGAGGGIGGGMGRLVAGAVAGALVGSSVSALLYHVRGPEDWAWRTDRCVNRCRR